MCASLAQREARSRPYAGVPLLDGVHAPCPLAADHSLNALIAGHVWSVLPRGKALGRGPSGHQVLMTPRR